MTDISVFTVVRDKGPEEDSWADTWSIYLVNKEGLIDMDQPLRHGEGAIKLYGESLVGVARDVYDWTQYSGKIKSGDLIYMVDPGTLGVAVVILDGAWPIQISGDQLPSIHHYNVDPRYSKM